MSLSVRSDDEVNFEEYNSGTLPIEREKIENDREKEE